MEDSEFLKAPGIPNPDPKHQNPQTRILEFRNHCTYRGLVTAEFGPIDLCLGSKAGDSYNLLGPLYCMYVYIYIHR